MKSKTSSFSNSSMNSPSLLKTQSPMKNNTSTSKYNSSLNSSFISKSPIQHRSGEFDAKLFSSPISSTSKYNSTTSRSSTIRTPKSASKTKGISQGQSLYSFDYGFVLEVRRIDARNKIQSEV
ncbi:hypothetical protein TVAG_056630 [Trichomonas vaginalis G3]|uniref:Uncharacterized protein n=1 Tax=Trichomonas vaginalis (strain ATCC PRA-98 / G3) TaxID=412133 RepID=A2ECM2_TRIV3|nr:hypothetical protein TVAGG3_0882120 [Trichomonas vaginalis G3]EAY09619.1 hypothetical protein TVAG_056630 [Trichomonas vaginalis G3]KAI5502130.1 hypothetical protein TVAGG3_0882120 [Trichomonas vaginalis G3]|eukprot:XP_001321842.1 hypothetical protein [Trichomonas vaginalis G3]